MVYSALLFPVILPTQKYVEYATKSILYVGLSVVYPNALNVRPLQVCFVTQRPKDGVLLVKQIHDRVELCHFSGIHHHDTIIISYS